MSTDPTAQVALRAEIAAVYRVYSSLARDIDPEFGLGGKLLYAGELNVEGSRLVRAANIAGAASLGATADSRVQKQALRGGVIDFLVTSLDEALRILKNELRKRQTVAVGIAAPPAKILEEMLDRGVLPNLLRPGTQSDADGNDEAFLALDARRLDLSPRPDDRELVVVERPGGDLESRVLACLSPDDHASRRWLRLSSRYLGPDARRVWALPCDAALAETVSAL